MCTYLPVLVDIFLFVAAEKVDVKPLAILTMDDDQLQSVNITPSTSRTHDVDLTLDPESETVKVS